MVYLPREQVGALALSICGTMHAFRAGIVKGSISLRHTSFVHFTIEERGRTA